jgi:electron transport complex protein RnfD
MENRFIVSSSPHIRDNGSTSRIMLDVIIALLPATIMGVVYFGLRALMVILVTVLSCVVSEYIARRVMNRDNTIMDFSAVLTGLLLALNLPSTIPYWIAGIGGVFAIVIVKQLFGGLGQNFMNPALAARVFLLVAYTGHMTNWVKPQDNFISRMLHSSGWVNTQLDAVSNATPLGLLEEGAKQLPSYAELFFGSIGGCIGETSVIALLIGAAYLLIRRVIGPEIPLTFIATVGVFTWIFGGQQMFSGDFIYQILSGGLIIGAFFMATDYATSPMTIKGRLIMGIGCGILTSLIRLYASYPEGVSFAIILMNVVVPLIDRYTVPKSFGGEKTVA